MSTSKLALPVQKVHTFLWFEKDGILAAKFYTTLFAQSPSAVKNNSADRSFIKSESGVVVSFQLEGQDYSILNGGTHYKLTPAVSLFITCEDQEEVDYFWNALLEDGGSTMQCGWLTDKFGVSWQVVPKVLMELIGHEDSVKAKRAHAAMLDCVKLDVQKLQDAFDGK
ncbi:hypothetical protein FQN57_001208 [Myotisia sp. PD_48]|nr:hypothetical protein FQN57_001208 [Myotisia sp. PD_48]